MQQYSNLADMIDMNRGRKMPTNNCFLPSDAHSLRHASIQSTNQPIMNAFILRHHPQRSQ